MRRLLVWVCGLAVGVAVGCPTAFAGPRMLRGKVVDSDGRGVPDADVALFWIASAAGLRAPAPERTDAEGRFSLPVTSHAPTTTVWAFDGPRARGGVVTLDRAAASGEVVLTIGALAEVRGTLLNDGGASYPTGGSVWVSPAAAAAYVLRVDPERDRFTVRLPAGAFHVVPQAPGREGDRKDAVVAPGVPKLDLGALSVRDRTGPPRPTTLAPALRFGEGPPELKALLDAHPRGGRATLLYFWEHT